MNKEQLLADLKNNTYCRLMPSKTHGVGIFAIKNIPKGVDPFENSPEVKLIEFSDEELKGLDSGVMGMIEAFCVRENDKYLIPEHGLSRLDMVYYLNHSKEPNMEAIKENGDVWFQTARDIQAGEELLVDYDTYSE